MLFTDVIKIQFKILTILFKYTEIQTKLGKNMNPSGTTEAE